MRTLLRMSSVILTIAVGCGDSGSTGGTADSGADTTIATDTTTATAPDTTTGTDAAAEADAAPTCEPIDFTTGAEYFVLDDVGTLLYGWQGYDRRGTSSFSATLREREGVDPPTTPGTYTIGTTAAETSPTTCAVCARLVTECTADGCKQFFATSGSIEITAVSISGLHVAGRLLDVRMRELNADGALIPGGRLKCVDELAFDTRPECEGDEDCAEREGAPHCRPDWRKCAACADDFDCASSAAPACLLDATDGGVACGAPVQDCNNNDPGEPDDGPAAARALTPEATLDAAICASKDGADWFRFELDEDTNVRPTVTWQGQGFLTMSVHDAAGVVVAEVYWYELIAGKNVMRDLVPALPAGTYYLVVRMWPGETFTINYTVSLATEPACTSHTECGDGWCVAGECRIRAECDVALPALVHQRFIPIAEGFYFWRGETSFDGTGSFVILTMGSFDAGSDPIPEVPGTYPFGEELNPRSCERCLRVIRCDAAGCKEFFAVAGTLEVETLDADVPVFTGRLLDVTLVELDAGAVAPNGKVACAEEVVIDTRPVCETSADCGGRDCLVTPGGTGACANCREHDQCTGELDLCSPATLSCVECITSDDCRTEPVCVAGTCAIVDECVADDTNEPLDDGKLGATPLTLGANVQRKLCGLAGTPSELEVDWFSHVATGVGLRDFAVRWEGDATITAVLYDPNGREAARETSDTGATIVRHALTPGTWLLEVRTLDVAPNATISYTVGVSRP